MTVKPLIYCFSLALFTITIPIVAATPDASAARGTAGDAPAAGDSSSSPSRSFQQLDKNHDGWLSQEEFAAAMSPGDSVSSNAPAMFKQLDKNGDGKLSSAEFAAMRASKPPSSNGPA